MCHYDRDQCRQAAACAWGVDGRAERRAEDQVPVLPVFPGREAPGGLLAAVRAQLGYQGRGKGEDELGFASARLDPFTASEVPATAGALRAFAAMAHASGRTRPA